MNIVEINGIDGLGKTSHIALFEADGSGEAVPRNREAFPDLHGRAYAEWWFTQASVDDLAGCFASQTRHAEEYIAARGEQQPTFFVDRGPSMHLCSLGAFVMNKSGCTVEEGVAYARPIYRRRLGYDPITDTDRPALWLMPDPEYAAATLPRSMYRTRPRSSLFSSPEELQYRQYQHDLAETARYVASLRPATHPVTVDDAQLPVHNRLRGLLRTEEGIAISPFAENLTLLLGFAGLSESGKSSLADHMRTEHGAYRLKLAFFARLLGDRPMDPDAQARTMAQFIDAHRFVSMFTVESLYSDAFAAALQRLFGRECAIVYCDADTQTRQARHLGQDTHNTSDSFWAKDDAKLSKGAAQIAEIADLRLNTSLPLEHNTGRLDKFVAARVPLNR